MDTPIYNIVHDNEGVLDLNPLVVYFFFTPETSRYKAIMANPCDARNIFMFESIDKGDEMAHILQGSELGMALADCNMLVRLFTSDGRNDEYFVARIPYEGRPRDMRPYVAELMNRVCQMDMLSISSRLKNLDENETDVRLMLTYLYDNLEGRQHDISYFLPEDKKEELKKLTNQIDELDDILHPNICYCITPQFDMDYDLSGNDDSDDKEEVELPSFKSMPSPCEVRPHPSIHNRKYSRDTIRKERNEQEELLALVKAKAKEITDAADSMKVYELQRLLKILSVYQTSISDSNEIAAGIFDENKSEHLTYKNYMDRRPEGDYDINLSVNMFETEGKQHKMVFGLIITINGGTPLRVHFGSIDSRMLYITTISRMKYNVALQREDMTMRYNLYEKKKQQLEDMQFMYNHLSNTGTKEFENWYFKMDVLNNKIQSYIDQCHKKQENAIDGAIAHANKDIFRKISSNCPEAMYYLGIKNNGLGYQVRLQQSDITLPEFFETKLEEIYRI